MREGAARCVRPIIKRQRCALRRQRAAPEFSRPLRAGDAVVALGVVVDTIGVVGARAVDLGGLG